MSDAKSAKSTEKRAVCSSRLESVERVAAALGAGGRCVADREPAEREASGHKNSVERADGASAASPSRFSRTRSPATSDGNEHSSRGGPTALFGSCSSLDSLRDFLFSKSRTILSSCTTAAIIQRK